MRKFIEKINSWIQWTKQWHFFHVFFLGTFIATILPYIAVLFIIFLYILGFILSLIERNFGSLLDWCKNITQLYLVFGAYFFLTLIIFCFIIIIAFLVAAIVHQVIIIRKRKAKQLLKVQSAFLLNNKFYNFLYINYILALVVSLTVLITYPYVFQYLGLF